MTTIYRCYFLDQNKEHKYVESEDGIGAFANGFWIDENGKYTKTSAAKTSFEARYTFVSATFPWDGPPSIKALVPSITVKLGFMAREISAIISSRFAEAWKIILSVG